MKVDSQNQYFYDFLGQNNHREATVTRENKQFNSIFDFFGGNQKIVIDAGAGDDVINAKKLGPDRYEVTVNGQRFELSKAEMENLEIRGGSGNDRITIDASVDVKITADGGSGDDRITSHANNATLLGGSGNDGISSVGDGVTIDGGTGNDQIRSKGDWVDIRGGQGSDAIISEGAFNVIRGGTGNFWEDLFNYDDDKINVR